jgi:hypothetical protein
MGVTETQDPQPDGITKITTSWTDDDPKPAPDPKPVHTKPPRR